MDDRMKCARCGKENVDPVYPHTCTPLALVLAEKMKSYKLSSGYAWWCHKAGYELERLHAENEALQQALRTEEAISFRRQLHEVHAENEALRQTMAEALRWCPGGCHAQYLLKTALARAGEKK
jgi:hypothetical protein